MIMRNPLHTLARQTLPVMVACGLMASSAFAHITLSSPTGGEVLSVGETHRIEWFITVPHNLQAWHVAYSTTGTAGPWIDIAVGLPPGAGNSGSVHSYDWVVPNAVSDQMRVRVIMDNVNEDYEAISNTDFTVVAACLTPVNYCSPTANSVGPGANLGWTGVSNVSSNNFHLTATGLPPNRPALFFYGGSQANQPMGDGVRCVGASLGGRGLFRLGGFQVITSGGTIDRLLNFPSLTGPSASGGIHAGETKYFQLWYSDPAGGPFGFNTSDALAVTLCP